MNRINTLVIASLAGAFTSLVAVAGTDYVQRQGERGWIFHTLSKEMPTPISKQKPGSIDYDYTYVQNPDSVSLLFSIELDKAYKPISTDIQTCDTTYTYTPELIYADPKGKGFKCRMKISFPYSDWQDIYSCTTPFKIILLFGNDSISESYIFGFSGKKWEKHRKDLQQLLETIKYNIGK